MKMMLKLGLLLLLLFSAARSQDTCSGDGDCAGDDNCCSDFGFCGTGEGFCTPSSRGTNNRGGSRARPAGRTRSGAGCVLDDAEWVGGDLPAILGGGGVQLDRDTADECFNRCEENPRCQWYTYDEREELCYLKSGRGYLRNRTDGFISGATFRDGCNQDPYCESPYGYYGHQCLFLSNDFHPWSVSLAEARRNINNTKEICKELGGFLPHDYSGFSGVGGGADDWHWVGYGADDNQCWACRPSRWRDGVRAFPCDANLSFGCERRRAFALPLPQRRPKIYRARLPVTNIGPVDVFRGRPGRRNRLGPRRRGHINSVIRNNPYLNIAL